MCAGLSLSRRSTARGAVFGEVFGNAEMCVGGLLGGVDVPALQGGEVVADAVSNEDGRLDARPPCHRLDDAPFVGFEVKRGLEGDIRPGKTGRGFAEEHPGKHFAHDGPDFAAVDPALDGALRDVEEPGNFSLFAAFGADVPELNANVVFRSHMGRMSKKTFAAQFYSCVTCACSLLMCATQVSDVRI